jgi:hypothetical protein
MLGGIGYGQTGFSGQDLDRSLTLAKEVQQFQPLGTGNCLANAGKLLIDGIFKKPVWIFHRIKGSMGIWHYILSSIMHIN